MQSPCQPSPSSGESDQRIVARRPGRLFVPSRVTANIDIDEHGEEINGDTLLLVFNADHVQTIPFTLPLTDEAQPWTLLLDASDPAAEELDLRPGEDFSLKPCATAVFRLLRDE